MNTRKLTALLAGLLVSAPAAAQDPLVGIEESVDPDFKPTPPELEVDLPEVYPEVRSYAGVGSPWSYATAGVGEVGGSIAFSTSFETTTFSADPQIGYFLWDNVRLSGILSYRHQNVNGSAANRFGVLLEPSLHLPINEGLFWFGGLGAGVAIADYIDPGVAAGLEVAPRTGVQLLVGRSGILNLGVRYSALLSGVQAQDLPDGQAILGFVNTLDLLAGYSVMF